MPVFAVIQALFKSADRRGSSLKPRTLAVLRELRVRLNQGYVSIGSSRRAAEQPQGSCLVKPKHKVVTLRLFRPTSNLSPPISICHPPIFQGGLLSTSDIVNVGHKIQTSKEKHRGKGPKKQGKGRRTNLGKNREQLVRDQKKLCQ